MNISARHIQEKKEIIKAVDDLSIDIKAGEIFGIIGFSGAGKSTLVRCINLLEYPDAGGKVTVDGVELTSLNSRQLRRQRCNIGMIFGSVQKNVGSHSGSFQTVIPFLP